MIKLREIEGFPVGHIGVDESRDSKMKKWSVAGKNCERNYIGNLCLDGDVERLACMLDYIRGQHQDPNEPPILTSMHQAQAIIKDLSWLRIKGEK